MRSNGLATVLLLIPILAIPAVAIFGIPQITPLIESSFGGPREDDVEKRTGNSSRSSHDDLFGDVDGFGSDSDFKNDLSTKRQEAISMEGKSGASAARRRRDPSESKWDDDLDDSSKRSEKWPRRQSSKDGKDRQTASLSADDGQEDKLSDTEQRLRQFKRQQADFVEDSSREASSKGSNRKNNKANADADNESDKRRSDEGSKRSRSKEADNSNRIESNNEQLTLNAAFERLNDLDIRSFRLEPGKEAGQFVFICSYTPENTPRVSYRFEASSDEPLKAVEKVLAQISEWQQRQ